MVRVANSRSNAAVSAGVRYGGSFPTVVSLTTFTTWRESRFSNGAMRSSFEDTSRYRRYSIGFASDFCSGYQTRMLIGGGFGGGSFFWAVPQSRVVLPVW